MTDPVESAMRRALALGMQAAGSTSPNPAVGCVVLDAQGKVAGEGFTQPPGQAHAEVMALKAAGTKAGGGTAVVTLEPCSHIGRTGPCVEALIQANIARVIFAVSDPTPQASGGAEKLISAGVSVENGLLHDEAIVGALEPWLLSVRLNRPFVTWKFASTLDGRAAAADGTSKWITSAQARAEVHIVRSTVDAIIAGSATVLADDPHFTVRSSDGVLAARQPLRVVLDRRSRVPQTARIFDTAAETLVLDAATPAAALEILYHKGIRHVLLEGGPTLAGAFVQAGLIDRVIGYVAPALLGGGRSILEDAGIDSISQAFRLRLDHVSRIGPDLKFVARFEREE